MNFCCPVLEQERIMIVFFAQLKSYVDLEPMVGPHLGVKVVS